jgi:2'-5' RNA ligase
MKRIFIAIKVDAGGSLIKLVSALKSGLISENIRWTNLDNIHITLVFLGDTDENMVKLINSKLKDQCEGFGNFELMLKGAGVFKNFNDPHVIWTAVEQSEKLAKLNRITIDAIREAGIRIEERPFKPHLTLGRMKYINDKPSLKVLLEKYRETEIQKSAVNEIILYESILRPTGPLYSPVNIIRL